MKRYYADLHIQSRYTASAAKDMTVKNLTSQAKLKGLNIMGTGDCLHPAWRAELRQELHWNGEIYEREGICFLPSVEIKDRNKVHHLVFLETLEHFDKLYDKWKSHGKIDHIGVPTIYLGGQQIARDVFELHGIIGPAHIFVPWQSLFMSYDSLGECYGELSNRILFVELGLSADTEMADCIEELTKRTFLSNSDNHSLIALGREFNEFLLGEATFEEIVSALENRGGRKITLNVGLDPREGKYYSSACIKCRARYRYNDALTLNWKCEKCRGIIRKGVADRIKELSTYSKPMHPDFRPPYMHMLPLPELIRLAHPSIADKDLVSKRDNLIREFDNEINILLNTNVAEISEMDEELGYTLEKVRHGKLNFFPGGGGQYGKPTFDETDDSSTFYALKYKQKRLLE